MQLSTVNANEDERPLVGALHVGVLSMFEVSITTLIR